MKLTNLRKRRGAAAVEFALLAPFLAGVVVGMIEVGRALQVLETLSSAARCGCRTAAMPGKSNADVQASITNAINWSGTGIDASQLRTPVIKVNDHSYDVVRANSGEKVTVQVSLPYSAVSYLGIRFVKTDLTSKSISMMRQNR